MTEWSWQTRGRWPCD